MNNLKLREPSVSALLLLLGKVSCDERWPDVIALTFPGDLLAKLMCFSTARLRQTLMPAEFFIA
jgi:hypothetical protein